MKIYIAGAFTEQKRLRGPRDALWERGHEVVSTWLDEIAKPSDMGLEYFDKKLAIKDFTEIKAADCLILDTINRSSTGGRWVELGYALANHKLVYIVGHHRPPDAPIFAMLADKVFSEWDGWKELLLFFDARHNTREVK